MYIYMEHPFLMFLDHTQRRSTVGRTPLDDYFPIQHELTGFYNRDGVCLLRGTDWIFIYIIQVSFSGL